MTNHEVLPLLGQVADSVSQAIDDVRPELVGADPVVRRSDYADFQSNAALALAKRAELKPAQLAETLTANVVEKHGPIAHVELSGPGFLNITVPDQLLWNQLAARLASSRLGVGTPNEGQRAIIDYSAPNIAKEMHVGHLRTTIIGDSLARVLGCLGAEVSRRNHLGDWGTQFGMLIQYLDEHPDVTWHHDELDPAASAVSALDELYKSARTAFDDDPDFADRSRNRIVALQSGDPATIERWNEIVTESEKAFRDIYERLGVLLQPDDSVGESSYNHLLTDVTTELTEAGIAVESDGARVIFSEEVTGPDGNPAPLMMRKRDGGYGYDTTDLATIRYRIHDLKANRLLYVTEGLMQGLVTAYTLAFGGLLLFGGRVCDRLGARRVFVTGLVGFAVASLLAGAAGHPGMLLTGRALQGVAAALLAPAALSLLSTTFSGPVERSTAFGVFGALSGGGATVGLLAGGVLTEYVDWRWCLYINVPVAAAAALTGLLVLRNPPGAREVRLDVASALAGCGGVAAAVGGFAAADDVGWTDLRVLALLAASVGLLAGFTALAARRESPLLPLRIVADRARGGAFLAVALSQIAMFGLFLFMTYYLQAILGYSPVWAGLAFVPLTGGVIVGSTLLGGRLLPRIGPRRLITAALLVAAVGMGLLSKLDAGAGQVYLTQLLPAQILLGLGLGGVMMPAMSTATAGVAPQDSGAASATVNAAQPIGGSLGTALLNTIATTATASSLAGHAVSPQSEATATVHGFTIGLTVATAILVATAVLTTALMPKTHRTSASATANQGGQTAD